MTISSASAVPPQSRPNASDYARSRITSALRLMILVVGTGLLVAFVAAGVFAALSVQLTHATN
jgi:hypothetical protein